MCGYELGDYRKRAISIISGRDGILTNESRRDTSWQSEQLWNLWNS